MPYELEDQILGDVDELHFAYGAQRGDQVSVAYTRLAWLASVLASMEQANLEVAVCLPLALMLPWNENTWTLRWLGEGHQVEIRYLKDLSVTVPVELVADTLQILLQQGLEEQRPQQLKLLAPAFEDLQKMQSWLPEDLAEIATTSQWDEWLSLAIDSLPPLNLRQQSLGRSLPMARWWGLWRPAAIAAGVALVLYLGGNWLQISQLKAEHKRHLAAAEAAYRTAMPQGRVTDPVRQLQSQLSRYVTDTGDSGAGAVGILAKVAPVLNSTEGLQIRTLNYVDGDMRLNIESTNFQQIDRLRGQLEQQQLVAELQGTNSVADGVQARLRVRSVQ
jgi:general secretion pathway protein L